MNSTREPSPDDTAALLHKILEAVEKKPHRRWAEITCAVVLSLATISSAWCAYQSTLWGGVQIFRLAAAAKAGRESSAAHIEALQARTFEASLFLQYIQAKDGGNDRTERFLYHRFRPGLKSAVDAWWKTEPLHNPAAPLSPFQTADYTQPETAEAVRLDEMAAREHAAASRANKYSDTYVLLTTLFAAVMFFGGIAGMLDSRRLRVMILSIALVLFTVTLAVLGTMPICRE